MPKGRTEVIEIDSICNTLKAKKQILASERERVLARKAARDKMVVHEKEENEE